MCCEIKVSTMYAHCFSSRFTYKYVVAPEIFRMAYHTLCRHHDALLNDRDELTRAVLPAFFPDQTLRFQRAVTNTPARQKRPPADIRHCSICAWAFEVSCLFEFHSEKETASVWRCEFGRDHWVLWFAPALLLTCGTAGEWGNLTSHLDL